MTRPITRRVGESLAEYEARAPHGEGVCPCCDGYGEVVTRHHAATRDEPASDETDDCDECEGGGTVPCDPGEECDPADAPLWLGSMLTEAA